MTTQIKSIKASILFSALLTFALIIGQTGLSSASEQPGHNEMIDHVYTPAWMGSQAPSIGTQDKVKVESQNTSEQHEMRDEIIDHVYTPAWMGSQDSLPRSEVKAESKSADVKTGHNEMIDHVYTPAWMGSQDPS